MVIDMHELSWTSVDVEFFRTDGVGVSGRRVERFDRIPSEAFKKYGNAEQLGWDLLAERFMLGQTNVKDSFVLISVNIETE